MEKQIIGNSPVGEKFFFGRNVLQVVEGGCSECLFNDASPYCGALLQNYDAKCMTDERLDKKSVAFKLVARITPDGRIIPQKELPNS